MSEQTLEQRLRAAEQAKQGQYDKRTEHLDAEGNGVFINRLILEDSPYLLQHAHNPVNWFPWGTEAFEVARAEDKPVFLSIGYSTCHWCHVMEVESFDNVEVAKLLNAHFISVKMDREQYPDLDEIYMTGVQLMTGQGGWPMSNFLLPDGRPFFGATYFPPPSFMDLLNRVHQAWLKQRDELEHSAASIDEAIGRLLVNQSQASADAEQVFELVEKVALDLLDRQDLSFGGLAGAPKFPQEPLLLFMLDHALRERDTGSLGMVVNALHAMAMGGIYDQVAGGFHRYSVDEIWLVPHFEKMLYNQSQLGQLYLDGWCITGEAFFRRILQQTLDYVLREMQLPTGGFYSATDADSEGEEGTFFVWSRQELVQELSTEQFELANRVFEIDEQGNFEGNNILKLQHSLDYLQRQANQSTEEFRAGLDALLARLYELRQRREPPLRDDKLIVAWNGAMINTLAMAGWQCHEESWLLAAERAAESILAANLQADGSLWRIALNGTCSIAGQLEDYANLIQGLITLFDVTARPVYLNRAATLAEHVLAEFSTAERDVLFLSPAQQQGPQLVRSTNASDGATLSPVATMLENCLRLEARSALFARKGHGKQEGLGKQEGHGKHEGQESFGSVARRILARQAAAISEQAISHSSLLRVIQQERSPVFRGIAYAGQGLLRIEALPTKPAGSTTVTLRLNLQEGWHLTLQPPQDQRQLPEIGVSEQESVWSVVAIQRPESNATVSIGAGEAVPAYGDAVEFELNLQPQAQNQPFSGSVQLQITVQLCTEGRCLLPETLQLLVRVPG